MKTKWIKTAITVLIMACTMGCGGKNQEMQEVNANGAQATDGAQGINDTQTVNNAQTINGVQTVSYVQDAGVQAARASKEIEPLNTKLFDTSEMSIQNGKENKLLALKEDSLYLYDVATAQIIAETKTEKWDMVNFYSYRGGYCAIGYIMRENPGSVAGAEEAFMVTEVSDEDIECLGIFYDDSLKEKSRICLKEIVEHAATDVWGVSPDGTVLGYYDQWEGLNLYHLGNGKKQRLLDAWKEENSSAPLSVNAIFFDEENGSVVFAGQSVQKGQTYASWGRVGMDGTNFESHIMKQDLGTAVGYENGKLLMGEDSIFFTGRVAQVDTKTKEVMSKNDWGSTLPVSGPFFSADGTVFATAALDTNQMELSVYSTEDFSLLYRDTIRDEREEMFYRRPQICLFPELQVGIVCMGGHNDIPQRAVLVRYGR